MNQNYSKFNFSLKKVNPCCSEISTNKTTKIRTVHPMLIQNTCTVWHGNTDTQFGMGTLIHSLAWEHWYTVWRGNSDTQFGEEMLIVWHGNTDTVWCGNADIQFGIAKMIHSLVWKCWRHFGMRTLIHSLSWEHWYIVWRENIDTQFDVGMLIVVLDVNRSRTSLH